MNDKISKALSTLIEESFADEKQKQKFLETLQENKNKSIENKLTNIEIQIEKLSKKIDNDKFEYFLSLIIVFYISLLIISMIWIIKCLF